MLWRNIVHQVVCLCMFPSVRVIDSACACARPCVRVLCRCAGVRCVTHAWAFAYTYVYTYICFTLFRICFTKSSLPCRKKEHVFFFSSQKVPEVSLFGPQYQARDTRRRCVAHFRSKQSAFTHREVYKTPDHTIICATCYTESLSQRRIGSYLSEDRIVHVVVHHQQSSSYCPVLCNMFVLEDIRNDIRAH